MTDKNKLGEEEMNRRTVIALVSAVGIATAWTKPVINSVITPAHAQTSCTNILDVDVLGNWQFTDQNGTEFGVDFVDNSNVIFDTDTFNSPWSRNNQGLLILDVLPPQAPIRVQISQESGCVASELTMLSVPPLLSQGFTMPATGIRN